MAYKPNLRAPISYYGGKQRMLKHILPLIPQHSTYTEPFVGDGAVFWAKQPAGVEVLNDLNGELVNFYQVIQREPEALAAMIQETPHSRTLHTFWICWHSLMALSVHGSVFGNTNIAPHSTCVKTLHLPLTNWLIPPSLLYWLHSFVSCILRLPILQLSFARL